MPRREKNWEVLRGGLPLLRVYRTPEVGSCVTSHGDHSSALSSQDRAFRGKKHRSSTFLEGDDEDLPGTAMIVTASRSCSCDSQLAGNTVRDLVEIVPSL